MKKIAVVLLIFALSLTGVIAFAAQQHDQMTHLSCSYCGMDRTKFGHSRMLVEYEDGGEVGTCSIHCMSLEFSNAIDRVPKQILVGNYVSQELIDAEKATWVLGGDRQGVMTARAKWAFSDRAIAETFIKNHGGEIVDFDQAMKASYEDMYQNTRKMRTMKEMKIRKK